MDNQVGTWRAPKPQSLPEMRRSLVAHVGTTSFLKSMTEVIDRGDHLLSSQDKPAHESAAWVASTANNQLRQARMLSVDASMTDISIAAARKLDTFEFRPESQPSPYGLMVFDKPFDGLSVDSTDQGPTLGIVAASWGPVQTPAGLGTWMMFWAAVNHDYLIRFMRDSQGFTHRQAQRVVYRSTADISVCQDVFFLHGADPVSASEIDPRYARGWAQVVRAAWAMYTARSKRKIAQVEEVLVPRPARLQAEREGYAHSNHVDVIRVHPRLRTRAARRHTTGSAETGYKIDYRKFVGSHLRWQPYPSRNTVEPIMIADYVQGPDGAPFRRRERVYRLDQKSDLPKAAIPNPLVRPTLPAEQE